MADSNEKVEKAVEAELTEEQDSRTPRGLDCRDSSSRDEPWIPSTILPSPDPEPGWAFRWIRVSMRGDADNRNVSQRLREGWVPVKLGDYPQLQVIPDIDSRFEGNIVVGGLMLCKNSAEKMDSKRRYHEGQARSQMDAVDHGYMRENDARMPLLQSERKTRITFGDGS